MNLNYRLHRKNRPSKRNRASWKWPHSLIFPPAFWLGHSFRSVVISALLIRNSISTMVTLRPVLSVPQLGSATWSSTWSVPVTWMTDTWHHRNSAKTTVYSCELCWLVYGRASSFTNTYHVGCSPRVSPFALVSSQLWQKKSNGSSLIVRQLLDRYHIQWRQGEWRSRLVRLFEHQTAGVWKYKAIPTLYRQFQRADQPLGGRVCVQTFTIFEQSQLKPIGCIDFLGCLAWFPFRLLCLLCHRICGHRLWTTGKLLAELKKKIV